MESEVAGSVYPPITNSCSWWELDFDPCSGALSGLIPGATSFANQTFKFALMSRLHELRIEILRGVCAVQRADFGHEMAA